MAGKRRRKPSPPSSPPPRRRRATKSAALERGFSHPRGDSFSPLVPRPPRDRFAHYPPPPGEELNRASTRDRVTAGDDANLEVDSADDTSLQDPSVSERRHDPEQNHDSSLRDQELFADGGDMSHQNVNASANVDVEDDVSLQPLIDVEAPPLPDPVGDLVPLDPQPDAADDDVVFAGVDGELPERVVLNLEDDVVELHNDRNNVDHAIGRPQQIDRPIIEEDGTTASVNSSSGLLAQTMETTGDTDVDSMKEDNLTQETPTVTGKDTQYSLTLEDLDTKIDTDDERPSSHSKNTVDFGHDSPVACSPRGGTEHVSSLTSADETPKNPVADGNKDPLAFSPGEYIEDVQSPPKGPYSIEWSVADAITDVIDLMDVPGFGDCGFDSSNRGLIKLRELHPDVFCNAEFAGLNNSWDGIKHLRRLLLSFAHSEVGSLVSKETSPVQDWSGRVFNFAFRPSNTRRGTNTLTLMNKLFSCLWHENFNKWGPRKMKPWKHWMKMETSGPLISLLFKVSVYCYTSAHTYENDDGRQVHEPPKTSVFLYRPDNLGVMTNKFINQVMWPHDDKCLLLHYIPSENHFHYGILKDGPRSKLVCHDNSANTHENSPNFTPQPTTTDTPNHSTRKRSGGNRANDDINDEPTDTKSKKRRKLTLQKGSLSSPVLDKHANAVPRKNQDFFVSERTDGKGRTFVTWKNVSKEIVPMSGEDFQKLVVIMKTPKCTVSPFKLWWRPFDKRFAASDIIFPYLKKIPMVQSHLEVSLRNNRVASLQHSARLCDVLKDNTDGGVALANLLALQQCDHDQTKKGHCLGKFRLPKSEELVIYKSAECSHVQARNKVPGTCNVKVWLGFTGEDVQKFIDNGACDVPMVVRVAGDCFHRKNFTYKRVQGQERRDIKKQHMYDSSGAPADVKPSKIHDHHNKAVNPSSSSNMKKLSQAYAIKKECKQDREKDLGLTSTDDWTNFNAAAERIRALDLEQRKVNPLYRMSNGNVDDRILGCMRETRVKYGHYGNRKTTPYQMLLYTYSALELSAAAAESGRLCCNLDGTGSQLRLNLQLAPGVCVQLWTLSMSASYMEGTDAGVNRTIRKNLSQFPLMQYISPLTGTNDLKWALTEFFDAQKLITGKKARFLHLGTDCAIQLIEAIFYAFRHDGVPPLTREQWNNSLLLCVRYCEDNFWETSATKLAIELLLQYAPLLLHWCFAHVMNAVTKWSDSSERSSDFKLVKNKMSIVISDIVRHGCSTLDLHEMIVHIGLLKYLCGKPMIRLKRSQAISMKKKTSKSDRNQISSHVASFVLRQMEKISNETSRLYQPMKDGGGMRLVATIEDNLSSSFVDQVCAAAQEEGLTMWMPHCYNNQGRDLEIHCSICYAMLPAMKDSAEITSRNAISRYDQSASRHPHFVHNVPVTTRFSDVASSTNDVICIRNPFYLPEVSRYMNQFVCSNIPTMSMSSCRLAMIGRGAVMDNTNQAAEGGFKWMKNDVKYQQSCKSVALYLHNYWEENEKISKRYVDQYRALEQIVEETNARTDQHNARINDADTTDMHDRDDIIFRKKKCELSYILSRLDTALSALGYQDDKVQYAYLKTEAEEKGLDNQFTISVKTFGRWKDTLRANQSLPKHSGTKSSWRFMKSALNDLEEEDSSVDRKVTDSKKESAEENIDIPIDTSLVESVIQEGVRTEEDTGDMFSELEKWRKEWSLLINPEELYLPRRIKVMIDTFCQKCITDKEFGSEWACVDSEHMPVIRLSEKELAGSAVYQGHPMVECVDSRKYLGVNVGSDEPGWINRYSASVVDMEQNSIVCEVMKDIPPELFPSKNETKESMSDKLSNCMYLDLLWTQFPSKPDSPLTSWPSSKQPARRTESQVVKMPYVYNSDLRPGEEEGHGENVITLMVYTNNECPANLWPNKPMKNRGMAMLLKVWSVAWPWCSLYTRENPPNAFQQLFYHRVLGKYMGDHRDNFGGTAIKRMIKGETPFVSGATVGGCENSQVIGSSVIVIIFTKGKCPMTLVFKYASLGGPVSQARSDYVTSPSYQMKMEDGWITVMDPVDDLLMLHSVVFDEDDGQPDDYRIAWVYRNLRVSKDFYVETSTIRRDKRMMQTAERKVALEGNLRRDIFC